MPRTAKALALSLAGAAFLVHAAAIADPAAQPDPATVPTITGAETTAHKIADCMAIWEPRTHMSKAEWRRTCITELKELPTP